MNEKQTCPDCGETIRDAGAETCLTSTCSAAGHYVCQVWKTRHKITKTSLGHQYTFIRTKETAS